jgi:hypothetical protein
MIPAVLKKQIARYVRKWDETREQSKDLSRLPAPSFAQQPTDAAV